MRIVVVINKSWEADPIVGVLLHEKGHARELYDLPVRPTDKWRGSVDIVRHPFLQRGKGAKPDAKPRIVIHSVSPTGKKADVEVWCIQDLMSDAVSQSSSLEKARRLPDIASYAIAPANVVIAVGTAALPGQPDLNGSVVVGQSVFVHDPFAASPDPSRWTVPQPDVILPSNGLPTNFFREVDEDARFPAEGRFLRAPLGGNVTPRILASAGYVALSTVNVTNYDDFIWTDTETLQTFEQLHPGRKLRRVGSMESTHGVIRSVLGEKFLFVSGIANPTGRFEFEVAPREYAQNFVASHNAGLTISWLIPQLIETWPTPPAPT